MEAVIHFLATGSVRLTCTLGVIWWCRWQVEDDRWREHRRLVLLKKGTGAEGTRLGELRSSIGARHACEGVRLFEAAALARREVHWAGHVGVQVARGPKADEFAEMVPIGCAAPLGGL